MQEVSSYSLAKSKKCFNHGFTTLAFTLPKENWRKAATGSHLGRLPALCFRVVRMKEGLKEQRESGSS